MSECSGNPANCLFCGPACAKNEVSGCAANPADCTVCQGKGCVAVECTGDINTCKACKDNFQNCRKAEVTAPEGIERVQPIA